MSYDPHYEANKSKQWFVGSEHGDDTEESPVEYRYDLEGWPYFIGIKETRIGITDTHIASSISSLQMAQEIARDHNRKLGFRIEQDRGF